MAWRAGSRRWPNPALGQPICPDCYDHQAAVVWNNQAGELWRHTKLAIERKLNQAARRRGLAYGGRVSPTVAAGQAGGTGFGPRGAEARSARATARATARLEGPPGELRVTVTVTYVPPRDWVPLVASTSFFAGIQATLPDMPGTGCGSCDGTCKAPEP